MKKACVLHLFHSLPNGYNSKFIDFSLKSLGMYHHIFFPWDKKNYRGKFGFFLYLLKRFFSFPVKLVVMRQLAIKSDVVVFHAYFYEEIDYSRYAKMYWRSVFLFSMVTQFILIVLSLMLRF